MSSDADHIKRLQDLCAQAEQLRNTADALRKALTEQMDATRAAMEPTASGKEPSRRKPKR